MFEFSFLYDPDHIHGPALYALGGANRLPKLRYSTDWNAAVSEATQICRQLILDCPSLQSIFYRLTKIERWDSFGKHTPQNACGHSVSLSILAWLMAANDPQLDVKRFVIRAFTHEFGEGNTGDVEFPFKTSPLLRHIYPVVELRETRRILESYGDVGRQIFQIYSGGDKSEDRAFEILERLDYILYALNEYFDNGYLDFAEPIARHWGIVKVRQEDLPFGWRLLEPFEDRVQPIIDQFTREHPERLAQEITRQDVIVLMEAALELLKEMERREVSAAVPK